MTRYFKHVLDSVKRQLAAEELEKAFFECKKAHPIASNNEIFRTLVESNFGVDSEGHYSQAIQHLKTKTKSKWRLYFEYILSFDLISSFLSPVVKHLKTDKHTNRKNDRRVATRKKLKRKNFKSNGSEKSVATKVNNPSEQRHKKRRSTCKKANEKNKQH